MRGGGAPLSYLHPPFVVSEQWPEFPRVAVRRAVSVSHAWSCAKRAKLIKAAQLAFRVLYLISRPVSDIHQLGFAFNGTHVPEALPDG